MVLRFLLVLVVLRLQQPVAAHLAPQDVRLVVAVLLLITVAMAAGGRRLVRLVVR